MCCSICLDDFTSFNVRMVGCTHRHCLNCFVEWSKRKQSCPMCRNENDQVKIFNARGKHIKDCTMRNLRKSTESICTKCNKNWTAHIVRIGRCMNHLHCLNCFLDLGRNECPICSETGKRVAIYSGVGKYLYHCSFSELQKFVDDKWYDPDTDTDEGF